MWTGTREISVGLWVEKERERKSSWTAITKEKNHSGLRIPKQNYLGFVGIEKKIPLNVRVLDGVIFTGTCGSRTVPLNLRLRGSALTRHIERGARLPSHPRTKGHKRLYN